MSNESVESIEYTDKKIENGGDHAANCDAYANKNASQTVDDTYENAIQDTNKSDGDNSFTNNNDDNVDNNANNNPDNNSDNNTEDNPDDSPEDNPDDSPDDNTDDNPDDNPDDSTNKEEYCNNVGHRDRTDAAFADTKADTKVRRVVSTSCPRYTSDDAVFCATVEVLSYQDLVARVTHGKTVSSGSSLC